MLFSINEPATGASGQTEAGWERDRWRVVADTGLGARCGIVDSLG